jgi:hypothetical protein
MLTPSRPECCCFLFSRICRRAAYHCINLIEGELAKIAYTTRHPHKPLPHARAYTHTQKTWTQNTQGESYPLAPRPECSCCDGSPILFILKIEKKCSKLAHCISYKNHYWLWNILFRGHACYASLVKEAMERIALQIAMLYFENLPLKIILLDPSHHNELLFWRNWTAVSSIGFAHLSIFPPCRDGDVHIGLYKQLFPGTDCNSIHQ